MGDERIAAVDGGGCIRRLEVLPVEGGQTVLLKISGARPLALELELRSLRELAGELAHAHVRALGLQHEHAERLADIRRRLAPFGEVA